MLQFHELNSKSSTYNGVVVGPYDGNSYIVVCQHPCADQGLALLNEVTGNHFTDQDIANSVGGLGTPVNDAVWGNLSDEDGVAFPSLTHEQEKSLSEQDYEIYLASMVKAIFIWYGHSGLSALAWFHFLKENLTPEQSEAVLMYAASTFM